MPVTTIGSLPVALPVQFYPPRIYVKEAWTDSWDEITDYCEFLDCSAAVNAAGISSAHFQTRYGSVKVPAAVDYEALAPWDLRDYFLRIDMSTDGSTWTTQFVGMIYNDVRDIEGRADFASGKQPWAAYGPKKILQNIDVSSSFWLDDGDEKEIAWLPSKNKKDQRNTTVGNRSADRGSGSLTAYLYGGTDLWTNLQYLEYVIERYVQQDDGPTWTINDLTGVLDSIDYSTTFGDVANVDQMLSKLIPREYGLDYKYVLTSDGFEITIFSLLSDDNTFNGTTMPQNGDIVRIERGNQINLITCRVVRSRDSMYDGFRVIGKRLVICATLAGPESGPDTSDLLPNWDEELEDEYIDGASSDDATINDDARKRDKFKSVYQLFTAPADFDYRAGILAPYVDLDGSISPGADFQNSVRKTLHWLPLFRDFDYSTDPATDNTLSDATPELQAPVAYVYNEDVLEESTPGYVECHLHGMSVGVPHNDLGVLINASPNHTLALHHAFEEDSDEEGTTDHEPLFDYDTLSATIAWECDQRLRVGFEVGGGLRVNDGSIKKIYVPDAEMWLLAPDTIVGIDADGAFQTSGASMRILRDDTERLNLIAAGEIARYVDERVRSEIEYKGHLPWIDYLGQILQVAEYGEADFVGAPITLIQWTGGALNVPPQMSLRTGYAE